MFLDLHEGILSIFAEAQACLSTTMEDRFMRSIELRRLMHIKRSRESVRRTAEKLRLKRHRAPKSVPCVPAVPNRRVFWIGPTRPHVSMRTCPRCGIQAEWREGCSRPVRHACTSMRGAA
jgi:hypothetical protein